MGVVDARPDAPDPTGPVAPADEPAAAPPPSSERVDVAPRPDASALIVPVELPEVPTPAGPETGDPDQPVALVPAAPRPVMVPVTKTKPTRRLRPNDLVCGQCGEGNDPARKFCSRCAASLEQAVVVKAPWWRRFVPRRRNRTLEAGQRPGKDGVKARRRPFVGLVPRIRKVVSLVMVIVVFAYALVPPFRDWAYETVVGPVQQKWRDIRTTEFNPVEHTAIVTASLTTESHPAAQAYDNAPNTFMAAPLNGQELVITFTFPAPVDVDKLQIWNGARDEFTLYNRLEDVLLVFSDGTRKNLTLKDVLDAERYSVKARDVTTMQMHVVTTNGDLPEVALSEVEFLVKE
jgi:hypothetical protein